MSWSEQTLGELMDEEGGLIQTGPFGSQLKQSEYQEFGIPVIMPTNIHDGQIDQTNIARISDIKSNQLSRHHVRAHTIVLPRRGEISKRAYIRPEQEGWLCGTGCLKIEPQGIKIHPRFLYYFMDTPNAIDWLLKNAVGSTMLNLSAKILNRFPVKYPEIEEQKHIASILSAYDDLIENNRRRIALLEESARLLYREWFVHLRFPGYETAKIIDGVPEGWETTNFEKVCETIGGGTPSTKVPEYWADAEITWITPTDITRNDCLALLDGEKNISLAGLKKSSAKLVPPNTILMTSRASVGFFGLIDKEVCTNQGFINIIPNEENCRFYLLFNLINRVEEIRAHSGGSTYKEISKGKFRRLPVTIPSEIVRDKFDDIVRPVITQIRALKKQSFELAKTRDIILPRLMDGRVEL